MGSYYIKHIKDKNNYDNLMEVIIQLDHRVYKINYTILLEK